MGMSSETFWDGLDGSEQLRERVQARAGVKVTMGSDAARQALDRYGAKRIGVVTPYMPVADRQVNRFFADCGYEIVNLLGLKGASPVLYAHVGEDELRDAILAVEAPKSTRSCRSAPTWRWRGSPASPRMARQAGHRDQHGDLLVGAQVHRHRRPDRRFRHAPQPILAASPDT